VKNLVKKSTETNRNTQEKITRRKQVLIKNWKIIPNFSSKPNFSFKKKSSITRNTVEKFHHKKIRGMKGLIKRNNKEVLFFILFMTVTLCFLFSASVTSVMAVGGFKVEPRVADNGEGLDAVFNPKASLGIEDKAVIGFTSTGVKGDYQVIVDTHGAGGVGPPDGNFEANGDWSTPVGEMAGGAPEEEEKNLIPLTIKAEWDGKDKWGATRDVVDGTYKILVHIDYNLNGVIDKGDPSYDKRVIEATVDNTSPQISVSALPFSPNGDGKKDITTISYNLSETVLKLELTITILEVSTQLTAIQKQLQLTGGVLHKVTWDGRDELGTIVKDSSYNCILKGTDRGGNFAQPSFSIQVDTEPPVIKTINPPDGTITNIPISTITVELDDKGGAKIDYKGKTDIQLRDPWARSVTGDVSIDEVQNKLTFSLSQKLETTAQNGAYTIKVNATDEAGNSAKEKQATFIFDTQKPIIDSVKAILSDGSEKTLTVTTPVALTSSATIDIKVRDEGGSGIDFLTPNITLKGPSNQIINLTQTTESPNIIKVSYAGLAEEGIYTLEIVSLSDKAKNTLTNQKYQFRYGVVAIVAPEVMSITPEDGALVNQFEEVSVQITDNSGKGIDFSEDKTYIVVKDKGGQKVSGKLSNDRNVSLKWRISPLSRDGSKDGKYTVEVKLQDKANNTSTYPYSFTFDTLVPIVASTIPAEEFQKDKLESVAVVLYDETSGVDLGDTLVRLLDKTGASIGASKETKIEDPTGKRGSITLRLFTPRKTDGTDDGAYTIEVTSEDMAGNHASSPYMKRFFLVTQPPKIVSQQPEKDTFVSQLNSIRIQLLDYSGIGIDFEKSTINVKDIKGVDIQGKPSNDEKENLTWQITNPLPRDGKQDGEYTVKIDVSNKASVSRTEQLKLTFDSQVPTIISTTPEKGAKVSTLSQIQVKLTDEFRIPNSEFQIPNSGVDFVNTQVRLLDKNGSSIGATSKNNGVDTITLYFDPLRTDGSQDGVYTIEITPVDRASNRAGGASRIEFTYSTKDPEITSITIGAEAKPLRDNDFYNQVDIINAILLDYSGAGINFETPLSGGAGGGSTIVVKDSSGKIVAGKLSNDEKTRLTWQISIPLSRDGKEDGKYTAEVKAADKAGNTFSQIFSFTFDSQIPTIVSTTPAKNSTVHSLSQVSVILDDTLSGIDFVNTVARLLDKNGAPIGATMKNNGVNTITLNFTERKTDGSQDGIYTIEITPADRAGNIAGSAYKYEFSLATQAPDITIIMPEDKDFVNMVDTIDVRLLDYSGAGIDFKKSTIILKNPDNINIPGALSSVNGNILRFKISAPLLRDGSQDGVYKIEVTAQDLAGNTSAKTFSFTYATEPPEIVSITPEDNAYVNQVNTIEVQFKDLSGAGIDFETPLSGGAGGGSTIAVKNPSGEIVAGKLNNDKNTLLTWQISKPLSRNGKDDGKYTVEVKVVDKAGNIFSKPFSFIFDSQIPTIISTIPEKGARVSSLNQIKVELQDVTSGVDFTNTQVRLLDKNNVVIGATKTDNGEDTITLTFAARKTDGTQDGIYAIEVTPADRAGNVAGSAYSFAFALATKLPEIVSVTPENNTFVSQINTIEAKLLDHSGEGIDFDNSSIVVKDDNPLTPFIKGDGQAVSGKLSNDGSVTLTWRILMPLSRDGGKDGIYSIEVTVQDKAGTTNTQTSNILFDSQVPTIVSTTPSEDSRVSTLSQIQVKLTDEFQIPNSEFQIPNSGVDTSNTQVRLLNPAGANIGATKTDNGIDTITLDFNALKIDGSQDGIYTIEVTPADRAGNIGSSFKIEFAYVTRLPELVTVSIPDLSFVNRIDKIEATLQDHSGKGIDFDNSTIKLKNPGGEEVAVRQFDDDQSKIWIELVSLLPTDGTVDGEYTVEYHIVDKVKTVVDYTTKFTYDSLPPSIVSISPAEKEIIKTNKVTIELQVTDGQEGQGGKGARGQGSGVNFAASTVKLSGPTGVVSGHQSDDGISKITYLPGILPQAGKYTIEVTLVDRAGNSTIPLKSDFDYQIVPPRVLSITPANKSKLNAINEITATLEDNSGAGLDFTSTGSSIRVIGPNGVEIEGTQSYKGDDLILTLTLATDGSDDGTYTVVVKPVDNTGTVGTEKRLTFIYDTEEPDIISVTNIDMTANVSLVNGEISRIEVGLVDATPPSGYVGNAGIDFDTSTIRLIDKSGNIVSGEQGDNDTDKIWWQLSSPLSRGGDADGAYTIEVIAQDLAGNREDKTYSLLYDTLAPTIVSTTPKEGTTLGASISQITVGLEDTSSGVDLAKTSVQLVGPKGTIGANKADDGKNTIYLNFKALKVDGSDDGAYRIEVIPQDLAGNKYQSPVLFEFFYITQKPEVISTSPEEKTFVSQLNQVSAVLEDHSGEGIDIKQSTIRLIAPDGKTVSGRQTDDRNVTIRWMLEPPLPTDGTADGEYTISVFAVDKAGSQATYQLKFFYDSGIPKITKISPADGEAIYEPIKAITIKLTDSPLGRGQGWVGSGVDLAGTNVKLINPSGAVISGNQSDDGIDTITYTFEELTVDGFYTIEVTPKDLSGNVSKHPFQYRFSLVLLPPLVKTVEVSGKTLPQEYLNDVTEITAEIEAPPLPPPTSGGERVGLDLTDAGSRIRLIGPRGEVKGEQKAEGANTLVWSPILPLATDGSDDGDYTVKVLPVNKSGRSGDEVQFKFMYDTVAPEVDLDTINLKLIGEIASQGSQGALNSLSEISAVVTDEQPSSGIDWKNVDDKWIKLENDKGEEVSGIVQSDKDKTLTLKLKTPLASNGSQDGKYTVIIAPKDKAGNTAEAIKYKFYYDTKPPAIDMTSLTISDPQLPDIEPKQFIIDPNDVDYPTSTNAQNGVAITAKITDDGLGVDLTKSTIVVEQPQGGQLTGILKQNGVDTIQLTTGRLTQEGYYRVSIVAVGLDKENIGINPVDSISATFLFEITEPIAQLTDYGGKLTLENETVTLKGTAEDKGKENIPASGVLKIEVGYEDAKGKYSWFLATDDSKKEEKPWTHWSADFLPSESGDYEMLIRVTDEAGNYEIYEGPTLTFTVSLSFFGETYVWPNPIRRNETAHFSFDTNIGEGSKLTVTLNIYDIAGYLVYQKEFSNLPPGRGNDQIVVWKGQNDHGDRVASGVYIFRLEADDGTHKTNEVGRILVVK
jgi:hypothetical protein